MKEILFEKDALADFTEWERKNKRIFDRILELLNDARENPFKGIGKPEPLKYQLTGCWSRRITKEHRLVYQVTDTAIIVIACKFHY